MKLRGRPVNSQIRKNIADILYHMGKGYGYDIYKTYVQIFPKVTLRSIYYHLRKGTDLGEFDIETVEKEKGNYSWGEFAEKIYYKLGKNSLARENSRIKEFLDKKDGEQRTV